MPLKKSSRDEISKLITMARSYQREAARGVLEPAISYHLAYEAVRMLCEVVVRAQGLRVRKREGHHKYVISEAMEQLGMGNSSLEKYLVKASRNRNDIMYEGEIDLVSLSDTRELVKVLGDLENIIINWLREHHPDLIPLL